MALIIISVIVILITALFLIIGGKIRDKFEFDKSKDEVVVEVNDSVKLLRKIMQLNIQMGFCILQINDLYF